MLDLKRVLRARPRKHGREELLPLTTPWGEAIDPGHVLEEHPRPQFARQGICILNGWWDYAIVPKGDDARAWRTATPPDAFDGRILVPFSPEAAASHVSRQLQPDELLWYRRSIPLPRMPRGTRLLLHFGAVDHACACYCNGRPVGGHEGGYLPFAFDLTDALAEGAPEAGGGESLEIMLCVHDPSDAGTQPRGKQRLARGNIWYTAQSGIWQSVWLEAVPEAHLVSADIDTGIDADAGTGRISLSLRLSKGGRPLVVRVFDEGKEVCAGEASPAREDASLRMTLPLPHPRSWSPDDPHLYQLELRYGDDLVRSYCAFRTAEVRPDAHGTPRFFLNGRPLQLRGVLDQGYWPEGLMTAPSDEALVHDIVTMKSLGFNMLRKHLKVECSRWYYHCDRLGMLVWQDMVSGGGAYDDWHVSRKPTLFRASWTRFPDTTPAHRGALAAAGARFRREWLDCCLGTIAHLRNHPCIVGWVLFNEGWGQFDAAHMTDLARAADPTRPIDSTSGWYDQRCGDFFSVHNYFRPLEVYPDPRKEQPRAFVISEFGGLTWRVDGHSALARSYGYEGFATPAEWFDGVTGQLARVQALEPDGLAGYVYTQLSDVEEETNGLLTYDRRVNKLEAAVGDPEERRGR